MILHFPPDHVVTAENLYAMAQEFARNADQEHADALLLLAHRATREELARWTAITEAMWEQAELDLNAQDLGQPLHPTRHLQ